MKRRFHLVCALLPIALGSTACSFLSPEADPTRFAVLAAVDEMPGVHAEQATQTDIVLGLGPIVVPEYLLRPEVQTRLGGTRLVPSPTELWGEPLDRGLERVLAVDLAQTFGARRVVVHPWYASDVPDVQVRIQFLRFEREAADRVVLRARWSVAEPGSKSTVVEHETLLERGTEQADGAAAALALSSALADLAREIADAWTQSRVAPHE